MAGGRQPLALGPQALLLPLLASITVPFSPVVVVNDGHMDYMLHAVDTFHRGSLILVTLRGAFTSFC